jgi:heptose I phosphotransferase
MINVISQIFWPTLQNWQAVDWLEYVGNDWTQHLLDAKLTDRLHQKQGRDIARWTLRRSGTELVTFVKRHYRHSRWQRVLALFAGRRGVSDGAREWQHLIVANKLGVPTARPLACAEWRSGTKLQSAIVLEELSGKLPLHEAIPLAQKRLNGIAFEQWKRGLIAEMVRLVRLLHDEHYFHRDLYLCHFYICEIDTERVPGEWKGRLTLIDFHRLRQQKLFHLAGKVKDLAQLLYSADILGVTNRDIVRFWRLYRRGARLQGMRWAILAKAERYRAHNEKRNAA